jgi:hypothetical protein
MSLKSIGYGDEGGRGGQFVMPDIVVRNGNIAEVKKGATLPQYDIASGLIDQQARVNQVGKQLVRQTDKYNADNATATALLASSPSVQFEQLKTDINTLLTQVSNVSSPLLYTSPSQFPRFYVRRGMGIRNTSYNLYSMVVKKTTTHFVSVHLALSQPNTTDAIILQDDNTQVINKTSSVLNGTFSQILLKVNDVVVKTMYSIKRTFRGTNIFITGDCFISLTKDDVFSIDFDFTNSYSVGGNDVAGGSAMVWGTAIPDPQNNNTQGQIVYCAPQTIQNDGSSGVQTPNYMGMNRNTSPSVRIVQF